MDVAERIERDGQAHVVPRRSELLHPSPGSVAGGRRHWRGSSYARSVGQHEANITIEPARAAIAGGMRVLGRRGARRAGRPAAVQARVADALPIAAVLARVAGRRRRRSGADDLGAALGRPRLVADDETVLDEILTDRSGAGRATFEQVEALLLAIDVDDHHLLGPAIDREREPRADEGAEGRLRRERVEERVGDAGHHRGIGSEVVNPDAEPDRGGVSGEASADLEHRRRRDGKHR